MQTLIILLTALLPVAILVFYICYMDRNRPEPPGQLIKAFFFWHTFGLPITMHIDTGRRLWFVFR